MPDASGFAERIGRLSPQRLALLCRELHARLEALEGALHEPIAIIGMGCRFPGGADSPETFWRLLDGGVDATGEIPPDRWDAAALFDPDPDAPGKTYCRRGGFLDQVDRFEPQFFGISPREAATLDPQHRLLLEVSWEALEDAGLDPTALKGSRAGVLVGIGIDDYAKLLLQQPTLDHLDAYSGTGNAFCCAAGRLSFVLGLHGPSLSLDTACSSSLVAVHLACHSLRTGETDLVLAGGVHLMLSPVVTVCLSKARALSPEGRCKTFDAAADGYARGEGCGMVVLKRLSDALADGDPIWALIRGSAVNNDGPSSGFTVPNGPAQQAVIRAALRDARVEPRQVGYVEAHGTGTPLGDPIELHALAAALGRPAGRADGAPLVVGSVKTNFGHLEQAAGVAGLIKTALALANERIPPHLNFRRANPSVPLADGPMVIPTAAVPWPRRGDPRLAGVSSFGLSGTNAHVVLEEAPSPKPAAAVDRDRHLLTLTAREEAALPELAGRYRRFLDANGDASLGDVCFTANLGRARLTERVAVVAGSREELRERLGAVMAGRQAPGVVAGRVRTRGRREVAFLFTGQGAQYAGMARQLYRQHPAFGELLDRCDELLRPHLARPLLEVLHPVRAADATLLDQTAYAQPALLALEYALAELWRTWGVEPAALLGHSIGELAAACVAGACDLEEAVLLAAERGRLMQALPGDGAMAAVFASAEDLDELLASVPGAPAVAAVNGPGEVVLSGRREPLRTAVAALRARGVRAQLLRVSHAFHSPLMEPILDAFQRRAQQVRWRTPRIPLVSNLSGGWAGAAVTDGAYWRRHLRQPVRFWEGLQTLHREGYRRFVEIGPQPVLSGIGRRWLPGGELVWAPSLRGGRNDWEQLLESLGRLHVDGVAVDWQAFERPYRRRRVRLPTYPFQRQRHWFRAPAPAQPPAVAPAAGAGREVPADAQYEVTWPEQPLAPGEATTRSRGTWLLLADGRGVGDALGRVLEAQGRRCLLVRPGSDGRPAAERERRADPLDPAGFRRLLAEVGECAGVVQLWGLDAPADRLSAAALAAAQERACGSTLHLLQALAERGLATGLWLVTGGAQPVGPGRRPLRVAQAPLWGLGRVAALEHPELRCVRVDLDPAMPAGQVEALAKELDAGPGEDQIAFRGGRRHVARLVRRDAGPGPADPLVLRADGAYLVTGGLGGLGLEVARWLVRRGARHLALLGRRGPGPQARDAIAALDRAGARVLTLQADVADPAELAAALERLAVALPPLRGVVHAAGVVDNALLVDLDWPRFAKVLAAKVQGAWNLHALTLEAPLELFVLFSSLASMVSTPGQANYAAANAFLDGLAHHRRSLGHHALSVNWGPWAEVGMGVQPGFGDNAAFVAMQRRHGVRSLAPREGLAALEHLLAGDATQAGVFPVDWTQWRQLYPAASRSPLLALLVRGEAAAPERPDRLSRKELLAASPDRRRALLVDYLCRQTARVLEVPPAQLPEDQPLASAGLDSIMALELKNHVETGLEVLLPMATVLQGPSIAELADLVLAELAGGDAAPDREAGDRVVERI